MGGGVAGFKAAALIDRNVDQHCAGLHRAEHVAGHQLGGSSAGYQHCADHEVSLGHFAGERRAARIERAGAAFEMAVEPFEHFGIAIEDGDISAKADRHLRGIEAHHAAADHHDLGRQHARNPAEQHPAPAIGFLQRSGPGLDRHPSGNLAHGFQQRQRVADPGHGFIGNRGDAGLDQIGRLFGIGGEVEVGVEHLTGAQLGALDRLRFLDLHHHFA